MAWWSLVVMIPSAMDQYLRRKVFLSGVLLRPWIMTFQVQIIVSVFKQPSIERQNLLIAFVRRQGLIARLSCFAYLVEMLASPHLKQLSQPGLIVCLFPRSLPT